MNTNATTGTGTYEIEARGGEADQADEQYRLVAPDGEVLMDWGTAFSGYADEYERLTGDAIDSATTNV